MKAEKIGDWGPWLGIDPVTKKRTVIPDVHWYWVGNRERAVVFRPGYRTDRRTFGRHGMEVLWLLRGPNGVTQFVMFTGWDPGEQEKMVYPPSGADLGYHSRIQQYADQPRAPGPCGYLDDVSCYYDGSGLAASDLLERFLIEGESVIWEALGERHDALVSP